MSPSRRRASARCAALQSAHFVCPVAVRTPATAPLPAPHAHVSRPCRAPLSRALAPPRRAPWCVRSRCGRARCPHHAAAPWRGARLGNPLTLCAPLPVPPRRAPWCGLVAVGRNVLIAPPRPSAVRGLAAGPPGSRPLVVRGASPPRCAAWHRAPSPRLTAITPAHYPCGAIGTSRPTAFTPANSARNPSPPLAPSPSPLLVLRGAVPLR